jgi:hypothetical protein
VGGGEGGVITIKQYDYNNCETPRNHTNGNHRNSSNRKGVICVGLRRNPRGNENRVLWISNY